MYQLSYTPTLKTWPANVESVDTLISGLHVVVLLVVVAFSRLRGFGENVRLFIPRLRFFFFNVEISLRTLIPIFRPGSVHSGSAN